MEPYVGVGASAAGYLDGTDYRNISNLTNTAPRCEAASSPR